MKIASTVAPSYERLRPLKQLTTDTFPVYRQLVDAMLSAHNHPADVVAHVLGVCAGYAYSEQDTVAMMMARLGLQDNRCLKIDQTVDAMFIRSTAYVVQSQCGRVVVVCYRGTEPANVINWLTDVDVNPEKIAFTFGQTQKRYDVHGGFYRNVRATRHEVIHALQRASQGRSVLESGEPVPNAMQALYFTGHSLGGAMATLLGLMVMQEPAYAPIFGKLKGIYTYGAPMIGDDALAAACQEDPFLSARVIRHVFGRDVVPELPPKASGEFAHFGVERHFERHGGEGRWITREKASSQLSNLLELSGAALAFFAQQIKSLRQFPFQHSIYDHGPQHYIAALTPPGIRSEFGD